MAGKQDAFENKILDLLLRNIAVTAPTTWFVALYSAAPTDTTAGTELVVGTSPGYARTAVTFVAASAGSTNNSAAVEFPVATANWLAAVAFSIMDASSGGNILYWNTMTSVSVLNGEILRFPVTTGIVITED